jgi:hypothetical protein
MVWPHEQAIATTTESTATASWPPPRPNKKHGAGSHRAPALLRARGAADGADAPQPPPGVLGAGTAEQPRDTLSLTAVEKGRPPRPRLGGDTAAAGAGVPPCPRGANGRVRGSTPGNRRPDETVTVVGELAPTVRQLHRGQ